jgi:hypothetical protein
MPRGTIYINTALCRRIGAMVEGPVQVGYDADARKLGIRAAKPGAKGVRRMANRGHRSREITAGPFLAKHGLIPTEPLTLPVQIDQDPDTKAQRIVAVLPIAAPQAAPQPAPTPEPQCPEKQKCDEAEANAAAEIDAAIDFEDTADEALTALPLRSERRVCEYCTFRRTERCMNRQSPHAHKHVGPGESCDLFVRRKVVAPPPKRDVYKPKGQRQRPLGKRLRVLCTVCRTEHAMRKARTPWPHDKNGIDYRAGRGDRDHRCPGSDKTGEPI